MIGYSAAVDKPLELGRLEAILNNFAVEANKPSTDAKTADALGVDLSPIAKLPPDLREAMAQSEALIRIGYEILNPPLMGQDEEGKVLSPPAMRAAFDDANRAIKGRAAEFIGPLARRPR